MSAQKYRKKPVVIEAWQVPEPVDSLVTYFGTGKDIGVTWDGTSLKVTQAAANSAIQLGVDGAGAGARARQARAAAGDAAQVALLPHHLPPLRRRRAPGAPGRSRQRSVVSDRLTQQKTLCASRCTGFFLPVGLAGLAHDAVDRIRRPAARRACIEGGDRVEGRRRQE